MDMWSPNTRAVRFPSQQTRIHNLTLEMALVENRANVAGGKGLLSRVASRDKRGAINLFVAGRLRKVHHVAGAGRAGDSQTRDKRTSTWRAQNAAALGFEYVVQHNTTTTTPRHHPPFISFFHFKIKVAYIYTLLQVVHVHSLYIDRANKYWKEKSIRRFPLHIYMELTTTGTKARRLFELIHIHGAPYYRRLFGLNWPLSSITSVNRNAASSSVIPSMCSCGWSSRM
jgi:hypothetical protein